MKLDQNENNLLWEYADLESAEFGSYVSCLLDLREIPKVYGFSEDFSDALDKELRRCLDWFEKNYEIETVPEKVVIDRENKVLKYIGD